MTSVPLYNYYYYYHYHYFILLLHTYTNHDCTCYLPAAYYHPLTRAPAEI
jgi:hypothetical protein